MANSAILNIPQIGESQNNKYITHNNAVDALEQASNANYVNSSVGAGPLAMSEANFTRHFVFVLSGGSNDFDVTFPSQVNSVNTERVFAVDNRDTTYAATVKASTGSGDTVVIQPGQAALLYQSYEDVYALALFAGSTVLPYDIGVYLPGQPGDNENIMEYRFPRDVEFADDFAGSYAFIGTNPTSTATYSIKKNGSAVGTMQVTSGGVVTFNTTGGATSFTAGDRLTISAPTPQDATLADVSITLAGAR